MCRGSLYECSDFGKRVESFFWWIFPGQCRKLRWRRNGDRCREIRYRNGKIRFPGDSTYFEWKRDGQPERVCRRKKSVSGYGFSRRWEWSVDLSGIWLHTGAEKNDRRSKRRTGELLQFRFGVWKRVRGNFYFKWVFRRESKRFSRTEAGLAWRKYVVLSCKWKRIWTTGNRKRDLLYGSECEGGTGAGSKIRDQNHSDRRKSKKNRSGRKWDPASLQIGSAEKNVRPDSWKSDDPREYRNDAAVCRTDQLFQCNDYGKIFK